MHYLTLKFVNNKANGNLLLVSFVLIGFLLQGCTPVPPWQKWMLEGPPPGQEYTPKYVDGWKHGCETGISASANQWYKMFYKFRQDPYAAQDRVYYKGWKDAFDYCQRYVNQYKRRQLL